MGLTTARTPWSASSETTLADRHRYGDPSAFDEVYAAYATMVYNLSYRMAGSVPEAEDLTQDVFLRIYRHLGRFRGRSTLKTWIYRIALNVCRSNLRRRRWPTVPLAEENEGLGVELVESGRGPESRALAHDAGRRVAEALGQLKPPFREAVVLRDLQGLRYEEIATVLEIRIGTVRSRIARGRERLRKILTEDQDAAPRRPPSAREQSGTRAARDDSEARSDREESLAEDQLEESRAAAAGRGAHPETNDPENRS